MPAGSLGGGNWRGVLGAALLELGVLATRARLPPCHTESQDIM